MTPFVVEGTRGERIGEIPPYVGTGAADSLSPSPLSSQTPVIPNAAQRNEESPTHFVICNEAKRSDMSNPEGLDAVNLFITGYLFFVPKRSKSA